MGWGLTMTDSDWCTKSSILTLYWDDDEPSIDYASLNFSPINRPGGPLRVLGSELDSTSCLGVAVDSTHGGNNAVDCELAGSSQLSVNIGNALSSMLSNSIELFLAGSLIRCLCWMIGSPLLILMPLLTFMLDIAFDIGDKGLLDGKLRSKSLLFSLRLPSLAACFLALSSSFLFGASIGIYLKGVLTCVTSAV